MRATSRLRVGAPESDEPAINASELGEFAYCHRGWWLSHVRGLQSSHRAALARGARLHAAHGSRAQRAAGLERLAPIVLLAGVLLALGGLVVLMLAAGGGV